MKLKSLVTVFLILAVNLSCSLFYPDKYMLDQNNLEEAFALIKSKGFGKEGLAEIDITADKVTFDTGLRKVAYTRGITREVKSESSPSAKKFQFEDIDISNFHKMITAASERARKNPYISNPEISRVRITKELVNRDDNLVSNVDKWRDAIRCEVYISSSNASANYTFNLQAEIVDVPATNLKPRLKFFDAEQMKKSMAEIKPLFGGKLSVADFDIHIEDFSFTALDPKNPEEMNVYHYNSQEFLTANKSVFQKTLEDKKREEEMRRGGASEEEIKSRSIQFIFFDIEEIDFSLVPRVMEKTLAAARASNPKIAKISIAKRHDQFTKITHLEWKVEIVGDRSEKESIIFDGRGNLKNEGK